MKERTKGILFMLLSALSFALMQLAVKNCKGIPTMEQVFMRNSFILAVAFFILKIRRVSLFGPKKYQPYLFARSFFGYLGIITLFYATSNAAQGDVTILSKLCPIITTVLAVVFLREKLSKIQIPALILSVLGAVFVFRPGFQTASLPLLMAFTSAVCSGIAYIFLSYFKGKVDGLTVIMHFSTFSALASVPFMVGNFVVPTWEQALWLLLIGVFGSLGQVFITYSYRCAPASEVSIYNYSGIVFSMLIGLLALGEPIKWNSVVGGALVIGASLLVYFFNRRKQ